MGARRVNGAEMATITLYRIPNAGLSDDLSQTVLGNAPSVEITVSTELPFRLFIFRNSPEVPEWTQYLAPIVRRPLDIPQHEATGAILFAQPNTRIRVLYAATWGNGRFQLRPDRLEANWGLRCALNLISAPKANDRSWDPARVRALRSKRVSQNTLIAELQSSRKTTIDSFPFSVDADQLRRVTGAPINSSRFGTTVSGGISIHIKRPDNPQNLIGLCREIEREQRTTNYKHRFGWIDNVATIVDPTKTDHVFDRVVEMLRAKRLQELNLSPPTIIQWENFSKFSYQWGHIYEEISDASIDSFYQFLVDKNVMRILSAVSLREKPKLHVLDDSGHRIQSWPIDRCLSGEFRIDSDTYILDEAAIYIVATDYLEELNEFTAAISAPTLSFPKTRPDEREENYNERISQSLSHAILLDRKTIRRPHGTEIEICDVATDRKQLIHVKRGTSSSSLSHLFAQGVVSAELLHMDPDFRTEVSRLLSGQANRKITGSVSSGKGGFRWLGGADFKAHDCEVVYVIMTERSHEIQKDKLPFFSKINLRMRCNELRRMGYRYSLALVQSSPDASRS
jgi:uncharacterized protein (TIGR04141 family)